MVFRWFSEKTWKKQRKKTKKRREISKILEQTKEDKSKSKLRRHWDHLSVDVAYQKTGLRVRLSAG